MDTQKKPINVLCVEDDPADYFLTKMAFESGCHANCYKLQLITNGADAITYLQKLNLEGPAVPDLILLDINLPRKNGDIVLAESKKIPGVKLIPIIMLTTTKNPSDIRLCYELGASAYLLKPADQVARHQMFQAICDFWMYQAVLPREAGTLAR